MGTFRQFIAHLIGIISLFFVVLLLRYPALINSDYFLGYDEAFMANAILAFMKGGPFLFFYEGVNYHGVLGGMTAVPIMQLLGVGSLAYKLPASFFYSLYIWSTFLIARQIAPGLSLFVILIMLFPPDFILELTLVNMPNNVICFIGNILLYLFIRAKVKTTIECADIFFLSLVMGFAIYSYTYAILHVFTIFIVFLLTHQQWESFREGISIKKFFGLFENLPRKKYILSRALDVIIVLFILAILFSYIFGGFGLDFAGHSILQINKLHKPVLQLLVIVLLRLSIRRDDLVALLGVWKSHLKSFNPKTKRILAFGGLGFFVGLFPRVFAIVSGEIKTGGQGFDVDLVPFKLVVHFWSLITQMIPQILGVYQSLSNWGSSLSYQPFVISLGFMSLYIYLGIILSLIFIVASQKENLIAVFKFRKISFNPILVLLIFLILTLIAVVISQFGPLARYLYPLFGVVAISLALFLNKIREISPKLCLVLLLFWIGFHTGTAYATYFRYGVVDRLSVVRLEENPLKPIIRYLRSTDIRAVYTGVYYASSLSFLSDRELVGVEYSKSVRGKKIKTLAATDFNFAVLIDEKNTGDILKFSSIVAKNNINYQTKRIGSFLLFSKFKGDKTAIDKLRSLSS